MLNINDIIERNKSRPEPPEVANIRENIIKSFSRLEFQEGPHKYYIHNDDGTTIEVPSVSGVTHEFKPHFDTQKVASQYALKHDMTLEQVLRSWEENNVRATNNGTSTHLFGEAYMHFFMGNLDKIPDIIKPQLDRGYLVPYSGKQDAILKYYEDLYLIDDIYPVMPEAQVYMGVNSDYSDIKQYAGTFDMLFAYRTKDNEYKLMLHDWKTNKELESGFNRNVHDVVTNPQHKNYEKWLDKYGINGGMALEPFTELYDESFSYYILQLSAYSLCLEQLGYEIIDRRIIWLKDDGSYEKIKLPDYTQKLRQALNKNN